MPDRVRLKPKARAELTRRYRTRAQAETDLTAYLLGVADALGIEPERIEGFDDATGELLIADPGIATERNP